MRIRIDEHGHIIRDDDGRDNRNSQLGPARDYLPERRPFNLPDPYPDPGPIYIDPPKPRKKWGVRLISLLVFILLVRSFFIGTFLHETPDNLGVEQTESEQSDADAGQTDADVGQTDAGHGGFIFPDSDTQLIEQGAIEELSDSNLIYAINEIYARHGYIFRSSELRGHYEQFSWYEGRVPADEFSTDTFNQIELQNWNLLVNERDRRKSPDKTDSGSETAVSGFYIWPTDTQYITYDDLAPLSRNEIMLMRNELYARYGCSFQNEEIRNYFMSQSWYTPNPDQLAVSFNVELFSEIERTNLETIMSYEKAMGWRE